MLVLCYVNDLGVCLLCEKCGGSGLADRGRVEVLVFLQPLWNIWIEQSHYSRHYSRTLGRNYRKALQTISDQPWEYVSAEALPHC